MIANSSTIDVLPPLPPPLRHSSGLFTGRDPYIQRLKEHFGCNLNNGRKSFLLYGMGGIGKTQICLRFIEEYPHLWVCGTLPPHSIWPRWQASQTFSGLMLLQRVTLTLVWSRLQKLIICHLNLLYNGLPQRVAGFWSMTMLMVNTKWWKGSFHQGTREIFW